MQDMKEENNKDIEILKKNQSEMNSSISQIKISIEKVGEQSRASRKQSIKNRRQSRGIRLNSKRT
jgi:hypothetical protein